MDDGQLLKQYVQSGDQRAFEELVHRHLPMVYAAARREVKDEHLAEDVAQAVFVVLSQKGGRLKVSGSLAAWLFRVAQYAAADARKVRRRRERHEQEAGQMRQMRPATEPQQIEEVWSEVEPKLNAALAKLGSKDREAILLRYFEDRSVKEVAEGMGVSEAAAKMRIGRGLEKLRGLLGGKEGMMSVAGLGAVLEAKAMVAAPAGLAGSVTAAVGGAGGTTGKVMLIAKGAMNMMMWAKIKIVAAVTVAVLVPVGLSVAVAQVAGLGRAPATAGTTRSVATQPVSTPSDPRMAPYAPDPDHLWNRLHRALFVRTTPGGREFIHTRDPLLYVGGKFLLRGEPHDHAVAMLDQFLAGPGEQPIDDPLKRLFLQHDLWAAFDYVAWYPDNWVNRSQDEPAAIALRKRLATAIGRLALDGREIDALPDNFDLAVKSGEFPGAYDAEHAERPFLPADLLDSAGPWVRFHESTAEPMAKEHFEAASGRTVHVVFLRLPEGRAATERYLKGLSRDSIAQFPPGTMVAMVRRGLAVDRQGKVRLTSVTELVQIRVYRRIPEDPRANYQGDRGEQDVYEFVLDRGRLFAGQHGLRAVGPDEPAEPFERTTSPTDPFEPGDRDPQDGPTAVHGAVEPQLKTCIMCHQAPGVHSVLSMARGLAVDPKRRGEIFRSYGWNVEMNYTVRAKVRQFNWGLLQGMLEEKREQ